MGIAEYIFISILILLVLVLIYLIIKKMQCKKNISAYQKKYDFYRNTNEYTGDNGEVFVSLNNQEIASDLEFGNKLEFTGNQEDNYRESRQNGSDLADDEMEFLSNKTDKGKEKITDLEDNDDTTELLMSDDDKTEILISDDDKTELLVSNDDKTEILISNDDKTELLMSDDDKTEILISNDDKTELLISDDDKTELLMSDDDKTELLISNDDKTELLINAESKSEKETDFNTNNSIDDNIVEHKRKDIRLTNLADNQVVADSNLKDGLQISVEKTGRIIFGDLSDITEQPILQIADREGLVFCIGKTSVYSVFINGKKVNLNEEIEIYSGALLKLGNIKIKVEING